MTAVCKKSKHCHNIHHPKTAKNVTDKPKLQPVFKEHRQNHGDCIRHHSISLSRKWHVCVSGWTGLRPSLEGQGPRDQMLRYRLRTPTWNDTMRPNFARYITAFGQESSKSGFTTPPNCMGLSQRRKKIWNPKEFGGYKYVRSYQLT